MSGSNGFGFKFNNVDELRNGLVDKDNTSITTLQQYWKYSMALLQQSIILTAEELSNVLPDALENRTMHNNKINMFSEAINKIIWTDNDINLDPSEFYKKFFAYTISAQTVSGSPTKGWRSLFEHITAASQCKAAEKFNFTTYNWDTCYICGLKIYDVYNLHPERGQLHDTRECEHILPAFTALGYKGLIQSQNVDNLTDDEKKFFTYEYANAHRCCNQNKSDDKWIKYNSATGEYQPDMTALSNTITNIFSSSQYDCVKVIGLYRQINKDVPVNKIVEDRSNKIVSEFLKPLLGIINRDKEDYGALFELSVRIRQITALKKNIYQFATAYLTGEVTILTKIKQPVLLLLTESKNLLKKQFMTTCELVFYDLFNKIFSKTLYDETLLKNFLTFCFKEEARSLLIFAKRMYLYGFDPTKESAPFIDINIQELTKGLNTLDTQYSVNGDEPIAKTVIQDTINLASIERSNSYLSRIYSLVSQKSQELTPYLQDQNYNAMYQLSISLLQGGIFNAIDSTDKEKYKQIQIQTSEDTDDVLKFKAGIVEAVRQELGLVQQGGGKKIFNTKSKNYIMKGGNNLDSELNIDSIYELKVSLMEDILGLGEELYNTTNIKINPTDGFICEENINFIKDTTAKILDENPSKRVSKPIIRYDPTPIRRGLYMVDIKNKKYYVTSYGLVPMYGSVSDVLLYNYTENGTPYVYLKDNNGVDVAVNIVQFNKGGKRKYSIKKKSTKKMKKSRRK